MGLKSAPYFWVECDNCGVSAQEDSDFTAWQDHGMAQDSAMDSDFTTYQDRWLCRDCGPAYCPECQDALPGPKEHESMCDECWDCGP